MNAFIDKLTAREKFLALCISVIVLIMWSSSQFTDIRLLLQNWKLNSENSSAQENTLEQKAFVQTELQKVYESLDPQRTFGAQELQIKLESLGQQVMGSLLKIPNPESTQKGRMILHSLFLDLDNVTLDKVITFHAQLRNESPYIAIEQIDISANKADPAKLDTTFVISSFELNNKTATTP